jgi:hypothetical protein
LGADVAYGEKKQHDQIESLTRMFLAKPDMISADPNSNPGVEPALRRLAWYSHEANSGSLLADIFYASDHPTTRQVNAIIKPADAKPEEPESLRSVDAWISEAYTRWSRKGKF